MTFDVCMCVCVRDGVACGGQRTCVGVGVSPSIVWVPGIKLSSLWLQASTLIHRAIPPALKLSFPSQTCEENVTFVVFPEQGQKHPFLAPLPDASIS